MVNSSCNYLKEFSFPDHLESGFRVNRIGKSSVAYGIAIFNQGENEPCAVRTGHIGNTLYRRHG
ncbi:MAG: hotdog domain-containing protein [Gammaproteobacteria bacterium]